MKVLFACGGTGGHINPAIASAKVLRERRPGAQILFAGASSGMETKLVPREGFAIETTRMEGLIRKPSQLYKNFRAVSDAVRAVGWAKRLLAGFQPDVVVGTGGYACFPVLYAACQKKIPTVIHESNAYPGLTTRLLARRVDRVLLNFDESRHYLKRSDNTSVVGTPIREDMIFCDQAAARAKLGVDDRPLLVSFWGSLGAREMNRMMATVIERECEHDDVWHIHATGRYGYQWMPELLRERGVDLGAHPQIDLREYIHDMPTVMAAADLVLCRGGASTLSELMALGKPAIIVPSPNVSANHQERNARVLEHAGGAQVIVEHSCDGERLYAAARTLLFDPKRRAEMSRNLKKIAVLDATDRIYKEIVALAK